VFADAVFCFGAMHRIASSVNPMSLNEFWGNVVLSMKVNVDAVRMD